MNRTEAAFFTGRHAADLAAQASTWLDCVGCNSCPDLSDTPADVVEWIRSARDALAYVAEQAPTSYSPGDPAPFSPADHAASRAAELAGHPGVPNTEAGVARVVAAERDQTAALMAPAAFSLYAVQEAGMLL